MSGTTKVTVSTEADCRELAANLRHDDRQEIEDGLGIDPEAAILHGLGGTSFTVRDAEGVILMFGAHPTEVPGVGLIWLLGTPRMDEKKLECLRYARPLIDLLHRQYPLLVNFVDARNSLHRKWVEWCGFSVVREVRGGVKGTLYYEIAKLKCVQQRP